MANKGWDGSAGGESVSSTTRTTGVSTQCSEADPFTRGSQLASHGTDDSSGGARDDLFEVPNQGSTSN